MVKDALENELYPGGVDITLENKLPNELSPWSRMCTVHRGSCIFWQRSSHPNTRCPPPHIHLQTPHLLCPKTKVHFLPFKRTHTRNLKVYKILKNKVFFPLFIETLASCCYKWCGEKCKICKFHVVLCFCPSTDLIYTSDRRNALKRKTQYS